ncbi:hypothetical protein SETIT_3G196100v2 [Setaria italica]|uniref:Uncharacterized protein n=1 Tax=Setaria italica TaxID=4555 RepID=A0A368QGN5_SETIT|nr:hypothetical protein SETIT_3G196100v2 [Setaria italica]
MHGRISTAETARPLRSDGGGNSPGDRSRKTRVRRRAGHVTRHVISRPQLRLRRAGPPSLPAPGARWLAGVNQPKPRGILERCRSPALLLLVSLLRHNTGLIRAAVFERWV